MKVSRLLAVIALYLFSTSTSHAAIVDLVWGGRLTLVDPTGNVAFDSNYAGTYGPNDPGSQVPIQGSLSFDMNDPLNTASMSIDSFSYLGSNVDIYAINFLITTDPNTGRQLAVGNMLADFGFTTGIPVSTVWDIQGLTNAIFNPYGLQSGDSIINNQLIRGGTVLISDLDSALPATDGMLVGIRIPNHLLTQGPTPMATTTWNTTDLCMPTSPGSGECLGINPTGGLPLIADTIAGSPMIDGPFPGFSASFDIGSEGIHVVPIPATFWLFGSGLLGLIGISRHK